MKHMKKMLVLTLVVMCVLAIAVSAMAFDGGYAAASVYLGTTTLQRGNVSTAVANLQRILASCGYSVGPIDGIFGSLTEAAVRDMQEYLELTVDGFCGYNTKTKLWEEINHLSASCVPVQ